jgi:hypothetical protein
MDGPSIEISSRTFSHADLPVPAYGRRSDALPVPSMPRSVLSAPMRTSLCKGNETDFMPRRVGANRQDPQHGSAQNLIGYRDGGPR